MDSAPGVMAVWNDLLPGHEREFEAWYQRQHVPERLQVPGFREARRYVAVAGSPRYCAFYWLDSVDVLGSPAYLERLSHPTRWTRRMMPWFRAMGRTPCTVALERGCGVGGAMSWIAMVGDTADSPPAQAIRDAFDRCLQSPELVRMQLWQCAPWLLELGNPEQGLRTTRDQVARWIVFIEATAEQAVQTQSGAIFDAIARTVEPGSLVRAPAYRLLWSLRADEAPLPCADDALLASERHAKVSSKRRPAS